MSRVVKAAVSCLAIVMYVLATTAWGRRNASTFPYGAAASWLALTVVVCGLWHKGLRQVTLTVGGAVVAGAVWSVTLLDFPSWAIERSPVFLVWLIVLSPAAIPGVVQAAAREGSILSGGLMLLLGGLAVFPVSIWNVQAHMNEICGDVT